MAEEHELNDGGNGASFWADSSAAIEDSTVFNTKSVVNHELRWYHIIWITISGVLGAGLYVRSGSMLEVGGPGAIVIPYAIFGVLAWWVMLGIAEMVCIWPVSNALVLFPRKFVDEELGTAVGIAYWFTYSIGFASLLTAAAAEGEIWSCSVPTEGVGYFLVPALVLVGINCLGVKLYGDIEVVFGVLKVIFFAVVFVFMIVINRRAGIDGVTPDGTYWSNTTTFFVTNTDEAANWGYALFIALQIAAWSFVGVEIPAVTALEAKIETKSDSGHGWSSSRALWFSSVRLPLFFAVIYLLAGTIASLNVASNNPSLPTEISHSKRISATCKSGNSTSVFVISAQLSGISALPSVFTVFLLITAWSGANTALYVASRTLYGLTYDMRDEDRPDPRRWFLVRWWWRFRRMLGETWLTQDGKRVPIFAILMSALAFFWVPYMRLANHHSINVVLDVLTNMGSVCCIIVWACECVAFIRYRHYFKMHYHKIVEDDTMKFLLPRDQGGEVWRAWGQPALAILALMGCLIVLLIADGAALWVGWGSRLSIATFTIAYITPICFVLLWMGLKIAHHGWSPKNWWPNVTLRNWPNGFKRMLQELNQQRDRRLRTG